jgi:hypothetical protein
VEGKTNNHVLVHTSDADMKDYQPPPVLAKRAAIQPMNVGPSRRTYKRAEMYVEDHLLQSQREWRGSVSPAVLVFFLDQQLQRAAERLIEE